ncbi:hypothetical protein Pelo_3149 [Pelomyxa schiedti]|nr:hypothetical protein Pelo_3149 [Pelomyxa schiedti]
MIISLIICLDQRWNRCSLACHYRAVILPIQCIYEHLHFRIFIQWSSQSRRFFLKFTSKVHAVFEWSPNQEFRGPSWVSDIQPGPRLH